jgi:hypothetical protein
VPKLPEPAKIKATEKMLLSAHHGDDEASEQLRLKYPSIWVE